MDFRKNSAITLVALVVTIIVLLILAGVSLSLVAGGDGILSKATKAVEKTDKTTAIEQAELLFAGCKTDYYEERYVNRNDIGEIDKYYKSQIGTGKNAGDYFTTIDDNGNIVVYSGDEAKKGNELAFGILESDGKIKWIGEIEIPEGLEVGIEVTYTPSGTYDEWTTAHSGYDTSYKLASGTKYDSADTTLTDMTITSWKVFDINKNTGEVKLVPSTPTTATLGLKGADGYNNAVKLLNDACSALYSDSAKGIKARSINIKDIENEDVLDYDPKTYVNTSVNVSYMQQKSDAYETNKQYPALYASEEKNVIDGIENKGTLGLSDGASDWVTGSGTATTSIQPYQTYYYLDYSDFCTKLNEGYSEILLPIGSNTQYWMASRCVTLSPSECGFRVHCVRTGYLNSNNMFRSGGIFDDGECSVFPIVALSVELIAGDSTSGWSVK